MFRTYNLAYCGIVLMLQPCVLWERVSVKVHPRITLHIAIAPKCENTKTVCEITEIAF